MGYRGALMETTVYLNAALTAFDVRKEIDAVDGTSIRVVYGVFDLADQKVHALPHRAHDTNEPIFGRVPASSKDFTALGDQLARAIQARGMV